MARKIWDLVSGWRSNATRRHCHWNDLVSAYLSARQTPHLVITYNALGEYERMSGLDETGILTTEEEDDEWLPSWIYS